MLGAQEKRVLQEFCRAYGLPFRDFDLLKRALTHRSYLSVTGQGPQESNERLEFLGDSVLGLVTSEYLFKRYPDEHEGHLTKVKSLLVSKAILSRRALRMGLGRFVLMSHSEVESGGRQRLSILADAFESVLGAIYLDQGFEAARAFIQEHLLDEADAISADKRHTNYKSHLQEYVQNTFRTHPSYRIRHEAGPDHSKYFVVEVVVGRRTLGEGRGNNKKEAEQAAARDALEKVEALRRDNGRAPAAAEPAPRRREESRRGRVEAPAPPVVEEEDDDEEESSSRRRRRRRGGRGRAAARDESPTPAPTPAPAPLPVVSAPEEDDEDEFEEEDAVGVVDDLDDDTVEVEVDEDEAEDDLEVEEVELDEELEHELEELDEPSPPAPPAPVPPAPAPAPAPPAPAFGRGRRRVPAPGSAAPKPPSGPVPGPVDAPVAEAHRVDPFESEPEPEPVVPPVVDVPSVDPAAEAESLRERDARIEEMERALENFGRRRSVDHGRRGRRR